MVSALYFGQARDWKGGPLKTAASSVSHSVTLISPSSQLRCSRGCPPSPQPCSAPTFPPQPCPAATSSEGPRSTATPSLSSKCSQKLRFEFVLIFDFVCMPICLYIVLTLILISCQNLGNKKFKTTSSIILGVKESGSRAGDKYTIFYILLFTTSLKRSIHLLERYF